MSFSFPCPLTSMAIRRADPGVFRVGELSLSLIGCNTWEGERCISRVQQGRTGPGSRSCWCASLEGLKAGEPMTDQLSSSPAQTLGFKLSHPNLYPIDGLQE